jgi:hypothetical protein
LQLTIETRIALLTHKFLIPRANVQADLKIKSVRNIDIISANPVELIYLLLTPSGLDITDIIEENVDTGKYF